MFEWAARGLLCRVRELVSQHIHDTYTEKTWLRGICLRRWINSSKGEHLKCPEFLQFCELLWRLIWSIPKQPLATSFFSWLYKFSFLTATFYASLYDAMLRLPVKATRRLTPKKIVVERYCLTQPRKDMRWWSSYWQNGLTFSSFTNSTSFKPLIYEIFRRCIAYIHYGLAKRGNIWWIPGI
jgi:hypothetical protein